MLSRKDLQNLFMVRWNRQSGEISIESAAEILQQSYQCLFQQANSCY